MDGKHEDAGRVLSSRHASMKRREEARRIRKMRSRTQTGVGGSEQKDESKDDEAVDLAVEVRIDGDGERSGSDERLQTDVTVDGESGSSGEEGGSDTSDDEEGDDGGDGGEEEGSDEDESDEDGEEEEEEEEESGEEEASVAMQAPAPAAKKRPSTRGEAWKGSTRTSTEERNQKKEKKKKTRNAKQKKGKQGNSAKCRERMDVAARAVQGIEDMTCRDVEALLMSCIRPVKNIHVVVLPRGKTARDGRGASGDGDKGESDDAEEEPKPLRGVFGTESGGTGPVVDIVLTRGSLGARIREAKAFVARKFATRRFEAIANICSFIAVSALVSAACVAIAMADTDTVFAGSSWGVYGPVIGYAILRSIPTALAASEKSFHLDSPQQQARELNTRLREQTKTLKRSWDPSEGVMKRVLAIESKHIQGGQATAAALAGIPVDSDADSVTRARESAVLLAPLRLTTSTTDVLSAAVLLVSALIGISGLVLALVTPHNGWGSFMGVVGAEGFRFATNSMITSRANVVMGATRLVELMAAMVLEAHGKGKNTRRRRGEDKTVLKESVMSIHEIQRMCAKGQREIDDRIR